ncbi:MAG TPA: IucA/IucC family protein [Actinocrinis sp.]|nr:IucA/IucC family protein [Actinocrinis sp.]
MLTETARAVRPATSRACLARNAPRADLAAGPEPSLAADGVTIGNLLRCWVRERSIQEPADRILRLTLANSDVRIEVPVTYWSPVGWHRFGPARLVDTGFADTGFVDSAHAGDRYADDQHWGPGVDPVHKPVDPATLAAVLALEAIGAEQQDMAAQLVGRVAYSAANTARFLAERWNRPGDPAGTTTFLSSEQALITGHPLHPAPKSRDELTSAELAAYSPELRGRFPLHWFAVSPELVSSDSARSASAETILAAIAGADVEVPAGMVPIPAHPWQAGALLANPAIQALLSSGRLRDLGPAGRMWHPTSSLRTVYRDDSPLMLTLSLTLRSGAEQREREGTRTQPRRGVEMHRILEAGLGAELAAAHPGFDFVRDQAWLAVDVPGAADLSSGLQVTLRENPFGPGELVHCLAGLVAERPGADPSMLACLVKGLAVRSHRRVHEVSREWFGRYLEAVAEPILWLYTEHGIALDANQQNTLVAVNAGGWPVGGRYRSDQGSCFAASRAEQLSRWVPHAGRESEAIVEDAVADEQLGHQLGVENLLGLIGAFGSQRLADEMVLLDDLRSFLTRFARRSGTAPRPVTALLEAETLRCPANLLTGIGGSTADAGDGATAAGVRPVYVDIPNPLARIGGR